LGEGKTPFLVKKIAPTLRCAVLWIVFGITALVAHAAPPRPVRVAFLGHDSRHHDSAKVLPLLVERCQSDGIVFDYFTKPDQCLTAEVLAKYDALMLYANHGGLKPEQFEALNQFVESGHGFLPIHCASACFGNDPRFIALVGGRFKSHKSAVFHPTFLEPSHPIFEGVKEYETWDETYIHDRLNETGRRLLAERVEGEQREPWTWVREQGKGRVFYTASGHDERTWKNPDFQTMLRNAILWSVAGTEKPAGSAP
jgi:type 1 glutamine amidotransferase